MKDMVDDVFTLIFAGTDTTGNTLGFFFAELLYHPEVYRRLQSEIENAGVGVGVVTDEEMLQKMPYLEACILELIRLYPVGTTSLRDIEKDVKFEKFTIPAGAVVGLPFFILHRNPKVFENPYKFWPERFMSTKEDGTVVVNEEKFPYHYAPFSLGPRQCLGKHLAILEIKMFISKILGKYEITNMKRTEEEEDGVSKLALFQGLTFKPRDSINLRLEIKT